MLCNVFQCIWSEADGPPTECQRNDKYIRCEVFEVVFDAELNDSGELVWSDGDTWTHEGSAQDVQYLFDAGS